MNGSKPSNGQSAKGGGPLAGIRIVEFGANITAPFATMLLADQGAEVVKVEHGAGDQMRYASAYREGVEGLASVFLSVNRNKRSILLDLKKPDSVEIVKRLVARADVVVQNFRPGVIERLGFGYDDVRRLRDDILYVSIDGVGREGPERDRRVYDTVIQGMSGMAAIQRDIVTGEPCIMRTAAADKVTALTVAQAVTAGLFARLRTGAGQHVRVSMLEAVIAFLWPDSMGNDTLIGADVVKLGTMSDARLVYRTKDDYILAACLSDAEWAGLVTALGRPDLIKDPRFATIVERVRNPGAMHDALKDSFLKHTTREWIDRLRDTGAIFSPINRPDNLHLDPQVIANGSVLDVAHPKAGSYRQPTHPIRFETTPAGLHRHAPSLGEHTSEIVAELSGAAESEARR